MRTVFGTFDAVGAFFLFKAFELGHGGEQRPALTGFQAQVAFATGDSGLEGEPSRGHAVFFCRFWVTERMQFVGQSLSFNFFVRNNCNTVFLMIYAYILHAFNFWKLILDGVFTAATF